MVATDRCGARALTGGAAACPQPTRRAGPRPGPRGPQRKQRPRGRRRRGRRQASRLALRAERNRHLGVCGERKEVGEQLVASGLTKTADVFATAAGPWISIIGHLQGRRGSATCSTVRKLLTYRPAASRSPACSTSWGIAEAADAGAGARRPSRSTLSWTFSVLEPPAYR